MGGHDQASWFETRRCATLLTMPHEGTDALVVTNAHDPSRLARMPKNLIGITSAPTVFAPIVSASLPGWSARIWIEGDLMMNAHDTSEIRELAATELDQVSGGFGALFAVTWMGCFFDAAKDAVTRLDRSSSAAARHARFDESS